jgi:membrane fusion protein (multidrug efflux system)
MAKRAIITLLAIGVIFVIIFGWKRFMDQQITKALSRPRPPVAVSTTTAKKEVWSPTLKAVGSLRAISGVRVTTELAGKVVGLHFESGQKVQKGALLVQLNDAPEQAMREQLKAALSLAAIELQRAERLVQKHAISEQQRDQAQSTYDQTKAQLLNQESIIAMKAIRAPFSGFIGLRLVDLGQYLNPGNEVATLQTLDPIYVDFTLPQQYLANVHDGQPITIVVDAYPGEQFPGKISAINPEVDAATRNFSVRATLSNADLKLRPGMFSDVFVDLKAKEDVITLPQAAVTFSPYGSTIYVVQEEKQEDGSTALVAAMRFVTPGQTRGDQVEILKGVKAGEVVVTAGQMKLQQGSKVTISNTIKPSENPNPQVPET